MLKGKKLLILGGKPGGTYDIVKYAKGKGVHTIVTDYLPKNQSRAKQIADECWDISTSEVDLLVEKVKEHKIDGVFCGVHEFNIIQALKICEKTSLPFYATRKQWDITMNKKEFKDLCRKFDIPVVKEYQVNYPFTCDEVAYIDYPVLIKPVDSSGARGIYICENSTQLLECYEKSMSFSKSKNILVEKYINRNEHDVAISYIIQNGEISLSVMADRYLKYQQDEDGVIPLPAAYVYPSKYLDNYQRNLNLKVIEMFKSLNIQNGNIFIQAFVENDEFIFYEMAYRLTGTLEYKIISEINGYNPMEMLVNYALTGTMGKTSIKSCVNPNHSRIGFSLAFTAKPGKVGKFIGIEEIQNLDNVIDAVPVYHEGETILETATGTLNQLILRVFATAETEEKMIETINQVQSLVKVYNDNGEHMLLDMFDTKDLKCNKNTNKFRA